MDTGTKIIFYITVAVVAVLVGATYANYQSIKKLQIK